MHFLWLMKSVLRMVSLEGEKLAGSIGSSSNSFTSFLLLLIQIVSGEYIEIFEE